MYRRDIPLEECDARLRNPSWIQRNYVAAILRRGGLAWCGRRAHYALPSGPLCRGAVPREQDRLQRTRVNDAPDEGHLPLAAHGLRPTHQVEWRCRYETLLCRLVYARYALREEHIRRYRDTHVLQRPSLYVFYAPERVRYMFSYSYSYLFCVMMLSNQSSSLRVRYICVCVIACDNTDAQLYNEDDVNASMDRIEVVDFQQTVSLGGGVRVTPYAAGHVLGAAMFLIEIGGMKLLYTGDYSRTPDRHLAGAEIPNVRIYTQYLHKSFMRMSRESREPFRDSHIEITQPACVGRNKNDCVVWTDRHRVVHVLCIDADEMMSCIDTLYMSFYVCTHNCMLAGNR